MHSKLTIITITKDDAVGLARTLSSAARLRAAGAQHIVIDGGGDAVTTQNAVAQFEGGIRVYSRTPRGVADAFNAGLAEALGEWVWFLNGGDAVYEQLSPDWLFGLLATTGASVITGAIYYDGESKPRSMPPIWSQWPPLVCWLAHPATLVRRPFLADAGGFDPRWKICMDYDLWFRLLSKSIAVDVISVPFARFDTNGMSQRSEMRSLLHGENLAVLWRYKKVIFTSVYRIAKGTLGVAIQNSKSLHR